MSEDQLPDFTERVLLVFLKGSASYTDTLGRVISRPEFKLQGDRLFLVSALAHSKGRKWDGVTTGIAWDCIEKYLVLDSVDEFQARQDEAPAERAVKRGWFG